MVAPVLIKILCSDITGSGHTEKEAERCVEGRTQFALAFPTLQIFVIISDSLMILPCVWFYLCFIRPTSYQNVQNISAKFLTLGVYGKSQKSIIDQSAYKSKRSYTLKCFRKSWDFGGGGANPIPTFLKGGVFFWVEFEPRPPPSPLKIPS